MSEPIPQHSERKTGKRHRRYAIVGVLLVGIAVGGALLLIVPDNAPLTAQRYPWQSGAGRRVQEVFQAISEYRAIHKRYPLSLQDLVDTELLKPENLQLWPGRSEPLVVYLPPSEVPDAYHAIRACSHGMIHKEKDLARHVYYVAGRQAVLFGSRIERRLSLPENAGLRAALIAAGDPHVNEQP